MLQKIIILSIGRNPEINEVMNRLINSNPEWTGIAVTTDEEALARFREFGADIVLFCNGITAEEEAALRAAMLQIDPGVLLIQHFGGGSGLLENEIREAWDRHRGYA